jgi:GNAT superfamily N-acetyltransferase
MEKIRIRKANTGDIPFLVDTIIEAEKSGTEVLSYTTIFGLTDGQVREFIADILAEEIDNCELSLSSFLVAEEDGKIAAAASAWIEGRDGISSSTIKGNLITYFLPKESIARAAGLHSLIHELNIDYYPNTIVLAAGYVAPEYRGKSLLTTLLIQLIDDLLKVDTGIKEAYTQIFECNIPSIKSAEKLGFEVVARKESSNKDIRMYLPYDKKLFLRKVL